MADEHPKVGIGHVHLLVGDVDRAVEFYTGYLGLDVRVAHDDCAFLSWGDRHHDLVLQEASADEIDAAPRGQAHVAFEVENAETLSESYRALREHGVRVRPVDHGISKVIYFEDPDGNELELYLDTREESDALEAYLQTGEGEESADAWLERDTSFDPEKFPS
jgi:catechol 2,3-dioxygenase